MKLFIGLILAVSCFGQVVPTPVSGSPDIILTSGGIYDYYNHQGASVSTIQARIGSIAGRPTFSSTSLAFAPAKSAGGGLTATGFTTKTGFTQIVYEHGIVAAWINSELGITKFDFATLGNFDGAVGVSFDLGKKLTNGKYHVYVIPFAREVSIAGRQVKPVFGLQLGTGFSKVTQ